MIGNIIGSIIKGIAPIAINYGSQIIKTKMEENVLDACQKQLFNEALNVVTNGIVTGIVESTNKPEVEQSKVVQQIYITPQSNHYESNINNCISIEDNSKYQIELRDFQ